MGNKMRFGVKVKNGNLTNAIKKWKNKSNEFGIKEELNERKEYTKPSVKKRIQKQKTIRENQRLVKIQKQFDE